MKSEDRDGDLKASLAEGVYIIQNSVSNVFCHVTQVKSIYFLTYFTHLINIRLGAKKVT